MSEVDPLWAAWPVAVDKLYTRDIGPLDIWVERRNDEFHYASRKRTYGAFFKQTESLSLSEKPVGIEWNRWICGSGDFQCLVKPRVPPRAVVVRPSMPVQILPGETVDFFVSVPVWVSICVRMGTPEKTVELFEEPTVSLSNSWFGSPVDGELCYALRTRARRKLADLRPDVYRAICPLTFKNMASKVLAFDRLCLRLQHLSLYEGIAHLWTNHGELVYRGEDASMAGLSFDEGPPMCDGAERLLSAPREPAKRGGIYRVLDNFKTRPYFWSK